MKKYEMIPDESGLYRIRALIDIPAYGVEAGDLGGFIEKEDNLSHDGTAGAPVVILHGHAQTICGALVAFMARGTSWLKRHTPTANVQGVNMKGW